MQTSNAQNISKKAQASANTAKRFAHAERIRAIASKQNRFKIAD
jgi:hypothetical protein